MAARASGTNRVEGLLAVVTGAGAALHRRHGHGLIRVGSLDVAMAGQTTLPLGADAIGSGVRDVIEGALDRIRIVFARSRDTGCASLLVDMVRENSVNPNMEADGPGEVGFSLLVEERMKELGLEVISHILGPKRTNTIGILKGTDPDAPSLMLNGHSDTVGGI